MEIKLPIYNILNMFLTGLVFIGGTVLIFPEHALCLLNNEVMKNISAGPEIVVTVCAFATAYEIGLIINRIGSVVIEDFLRWSNWISFNDDYVLFNKKRKEYPIMSVLAREYALSRTGIILFLLLFALACIACKWKVAIVCAIIVMVYYMSCRKHSSKIVAFMELKELTETNKCGEKE